MSVTTAARVLIMSVTTAARVLTMSVTTAARVLIMSVTTAARVLIKISSLIRSLWFNSFFLSLFLIEQLLGAMRSYISIDKY